MGASFLIIVAFLILLAAYLFYGRFLTRRFDLNPKRATPAHEKKDGIDYVPTKKPILFGHHFASIAGAGPILGPIYAAIFGWVPVFLWILIGSIFMGGVHDLSAIVASIRHGGKSIGEVIEEHIGRSGKRLFLIFSWFMLILVIAVFCKAIASVFVKEPSTVTASMLFCILAISFGLSLYRLKLPLAIASIIGVILLFGSIVMGIYFPIQGSLTFWMMLLFLYCFFAAIAPVWILLQPRDYLNSFLLYVLIIGGLVGTMVSNPTISFPAITTFQTDLGYLFPILFVTVACGAISGFHSLVSSGTTSKQLNIEPDAKAVGYGSMLIEAMLAVVAMITAVTIMQGDYKHLITASGGGPIGIFSNGVGGFISKLGIPVNVGVTFAALAISAFALTTMDTATRLGRFVFQEFFEKETKLAFLSRNRYIATLITVTCAAYLAFSGTGNSLWPLFGTANQLLAAMVLLAVTVWLTNLKVNNRFVKYPMIFMSLVTLFALANLTYNNALAKNFVLFTIAILLFVVAIFLFVQAIKHLPGKNAKSQEN